MLDLSSVARRKSITISDLKQRAEQIHREVGEEGRVYTVRYGEHEDMALVPLDELIELAEMIADGAGPNGDARETASSAAMSKAVIPLVRTIPILWR